MAGNQQSRLFSLILLSFLVVMDGPIAVRSQVRHPLPVLWMMPFSSGPWMRENQRYLNQSSAQMSTAVTLALRDLQRQTPPLGNYDIQLHMLDSQCDPSVALKALFDSVWAGPEYLLLIGGGLCPSVTSLIARSLPALNLVQISFAASSPSLSNRRLSGNMFSTLPTDRALNLGTVKLLQRHKWSRVGVLTQQGDRLAEMNKDLLKQLLKADVHMVSSQRFSGDVCSSLRNIKESDARIIIAQFEEDSASEVFCCAYKLNLFGPRYQWLLVGGGPGLRFGSHVSGCTSSNLLTAANGSIMLRVRQLSNTHTPGVSGRSPQGYQEAYLKELKSGSKLNFTPLHGYAYDAVWVAGIALVQVMEEVKHREKYSVHRNTSVTKEQVHKKLLEAVKETQFEGVTGPVFFRNGERMTSLDVIQFQGSSSVLVGEFNTSSQQLRLTKNLLKFKGAGPARDRTVVVYQRQSVSLLTYAMVSSAAAATITLTVILLCLTVCYRKHWLQRRGIGSQDGLLLLGILLSSSSLLFSGLDQATLSNNTLDICCSVRVWTLSVGHTVGLAVLFTRSWRIYSQCRIKQPQVHAGCVVLWMLLLDAFVLISWQILDPLRRVEMQHSIVSDYFDQDVVVHSYSEQCSSSNMDMWLTAIYGYKAPLLGLGCFVGWSIWMEPADHPAVSSKHLTLSLFSVTVFSVLAVLASMLTSQYPPVQFCLASGLILCCNVFVLSAMFGPKLVYVCLNGSQLKEAESPEREDGDGLIRLNQQLKSQTEQLEVEIETITMQLSETSDSSDFEPGENNYGELRSSAHKALVSSGERNSEEKPSSPDAVNCPEHVLRRLSVQLPILHHAYLPVIGGVSASTSSLNAFLHHDTL